MAKNARDWATAVREFEAVLAWSPHNAQAHYDLATALKGGGQVEEAARELQIAMKLNPGIASSRVASPR
jgi:Flp pilus assembly protein TadD